MDNTLARDIGNSEYKIRYDAACRNILSDKHILAWILKETLTEYKGDSVDDILKHIENPEIASVRVEDTNAPERVVGISDSDKSLYEGNIFYDIRFSASTKDAFSDLIINIEEQNDFYPGYPILKRAAYYCARMISAQNGTIFSYQNYDKLRKVVSVWICPNPPKKYENSITRFSAQEENLFGVGNYNKIDYDIANIVLINLGNPKNEKTNLLRLLSVLLSTEIKPDEKKQILEEDFEIPMTKKMTKEARVMSSLLDGVEQRGYDRGKREGKRDMILEMLRANQPLELIAKFSKFTKEKILEIGEQNGIAIKCP